MSDGGDPALVGRTIAGKYVVEKYLGGGAMGAVYRARQQSLDRHVAVKVLHASVANDPMFVTRFHREARAASRLDHPSSIRVVDFGEEPDGLLYIAMEYLEGRDLFRVIHEDWPLSEQRIVRILMQVLAALAVAHDMGVVHRDLKPENIMILRGTDDEGADVDLVKVCDFGIAKITEKDDEPAGSGAVEKLTTRGFLVGTPEYMSPEQARGEPLDARSDLYAIGVILYQLLTGRMPFAGDSPVAVILKQISSVPDAPHTIYPDVNRDLEAVCMRALEKERDARFASAREMRAALRAALEGRAPIPADLASVPPPREITSSLGSAPTRKVSGETEGSTAPATPTPTRPPSGVGTAPGASASAAPTTSAPRPSRSATALRASRGPAIATGLGVVLLIALSVAGFVLRDRLFEPTTSDTTPTSAQGSPSLPPLTSASADEPPPSASAAPSTRPDNGGPPSATPPAPPGSPSDVRTAAPHRRPRRPAATPKVERPAASAP